MFGPPILLNVLSSVDSSGPGGLPTIVQPVKSLHCASSFGIPPASNRASWNSNLEWSSELTSANPSGNHDLEESCFFRCINCTGLGTGIVVMWATNHDECLSNPPNRFEKRLLADER